MYAANRTRHGRVYKRAAMVRTHPLNRQCIGWWAGVPGFNGGGAWHDLAYSGTATLTNTTWGVRARPGELGSVIFNGTSSYGAIANSGILSPTAAITVGCWVKLASTSSGTFGQRLVAKWDGSATWILQLAYSSPTAWTAYVQTSTLKSASSTTSVDTNWHHVLFTYDGANIVLYIDGISVATTPQTGAITTNSHAVYLGTDETHAGQFLNGALGDVRIMSRALPAAEVLQLYNLSRLGYPGVLARDDQATWAALYSGGAAPPATIWPWWINSGAALGSGIN